MTDSFKKLLSFLDHLEDAHLAYSVLHPRDSLMVVVHVPEGYCEIEFPAEGDIEVEWFRRGEGVDLVDSAWLDTFIADQIRKHEVDTVPVPNGPWPSWTLDPPQHPPVMTREEAVAYIKHQYNYPSDMPDDIWITEYGALQEWEPPYPSVKVEGSPWTNHVWKVTSSGERLANYWFPQSPHQKPPPNEVIGFMVDDEEGRGFAAKQWTTQ
jgi:hypothetical protein